MLKMRSESGVHILTLLLCFGLPLFFPVTPAYGPLAAVLVMSLLLWTATVKSHDPFLSTGLVAVHTTLLYANCVAYGLSSTPIPGEFSQATAVALGAYLVAVLGMIAPSGRRVNDIDLEYFRYSLPSRRLSVDVGRRTGQLDGNQAALRLQLFVKEGLQFRRLSRFCRLLLLQCWGGMLVFLVFGAREPLHLLLFLLTSVALGASAASVASRATLHSGGDASISGEEPFEEEELEDDEESRELVERYLQRRRASVG